MSKLEKLIKELCPDGVEYKTLGEISIFRRGSFPQPYGNSAWYGGEEAMPFVQVADVSDDNFQLNIKTKQTISKIAQQQSVFVPKNSVIVSLQGTIGRVAITQYDSFVDRTLGIFTDYKIEIDKKYFAYQLKQIFAEKKINARGSTLKTITKEEFSMFLIPLPPLPVQREIVRILDNFTELTAELTAELVARKQQYEYYKYKLLNGNGKSRKIKLKEVAHYSKTRIAATDVYDENYVGVDNLLQDKKGKTTSNFTPNTGNLTQYNIGDILIGNIRPYLKKIWFATNIGGASGDVLVIQKNSTDILERYLYMVLSTDEFFGYNMQNAKGAKMPRGNKEAIMDYEFSLPKIEEQEKIIDILDRFDLLCNNVSEGLPAEIEARKQQYEYYRDKLLSFKIKNN